MDPSSPQSPIKKGKRASLLEMFPDINLGSPSSSSSSKVLGAMYCLKGSFSQGWPPASVLFQNSQGNVPERTRALNFTLRMSQDYRVYPDNWRTEYTIVDKPADVSTSFQATQGIISEISEMMKARDSGANDREVVMFEEMARAVFGSNSIDRLGLGLDETMRLCIAIFQGSEGLDYNERSEIYQAKLDAYVKKGTKEGEKSSRREVVQHAAAFQHILVWIRPNQEILASKSFGGKYRQGNEKAFGGANEYVKPSQIPVAMNSLVENLQKDIAEIEENAVLDPFMLAANYCDRFVNIHPFKDGNGRVCRLILNAILIKYAGVVVSLGEKGGERDEYLFIAAESTRVGGHPGQLGKKVLEIAYGTLRKLKMTLSRRG
ncbi:uncharacterized protein RSE6_09521 [Rhynchosporium secalis]|uniref:Fido domain-containing protein n=1 Tax=Rhynchosporium secalis TaxID=38038 RepID=A0A1E1MI78_RHYSE|nr:uncharacterized protein RSE6_09521 [Rhynchosporium secalis]